MTEKNSFKVNISVITHDDCTRILIYKNMYISLHNIPLCMHTIHTCKLTLIHKYVTTFIHTFMHIYIT